MDEARTPTETASRPSDHPDRPGRPDGAETRPRRGLRGRVGLVLKGVAMGAADIVPGVSGGTMALILGIYRELIGTLRAFARPPLWRAVARGDVRGALREANLGFLLPLGIGIVLAIATLAGVLGHLLATSPERVFAFFFGLVGASVLIVAARVRGWAPVVVAAAVAAAVAAFWIAGLTPAVTPDAPWFLVLSGAVAICAMILPGISGSFILLLLGKYDFALGAVREPRLGDLALLAFGAVVGLFSFVQLLGWLFRRHERATLAVLAGLMAGFLRRVWPWQADRADGFVTLPPPTLADGLVGLGLAALGAVVVLGLERLGAARAPAAEPGGARPPG